MDALKHHQGFSKKLASKDLFYQFWIPDESPKALILIVHGLTGHSGRYSEFVNFFTQSGYGIFAIDLPGHGRSAGEKAFIPTFSEFTKTLKNAVSRIKRLFPSVPLFILGHSMGGLITTEYIIFNECPVEGVILSCPSIKTTKPVKPLKYFLGSLFSLLVPKFHFQKLYTSNCPTLKNTSDPYMYKGRITARLSIELLKAMKRVINKAVCVKKPLLILQCQEDSLVSPEGAKALFERVQSTDKTLKMYHTSSHEILSTTKNNKVIDDLSHWLQRHTPSLKATCLQNEPVWG